MTKTKIIWSRAGRGGDEALLSELLAAAAKGEPCRWIVPEPYSHATERLLAERGGAPVCLHAEVLTFRRLCDHILAAGGGLAAPVLDAGGRLLLMRRALRSVAGQLKTLHIFATKPGFLPGLIQTLDECKNYGVTPQLLERAGGEKLSDLALIFSAYDMLCAQSAMDPRDRVTLAWKKSKSIRFGKDAHIYVSHFASFTPQERLLLMALADHAASFAILLRGELAEPGFAPLHITARPFAERGAEHLSVDKPAVGPKPPLQHMERHWFDRKPPPFAEGAGGSVELYAAPGEAAEVRFAAERLLRLVREEGCRWRDIAVIASDYRAYGPLIESIFPQYHIPFFSDQMDDMAQKPLARCIRAASGCVRYGYRADDVMALLRSGLLPVSWEDADLFESYLRRWNPRGGRFSGGDWTRPLGGWHDEADDAELKRLSRINAVRRLLSGSLKSLSGGKTARRCAAALVETLEGLGVREGLDRRAETLALSGEGKLANESLQMWELFSRCLEQCAGLLGDDVMDPHEFCEWCLLVLSGYTVGSIPPSLDRVHTGDQGRFPRIPFPVVIYLGASSEHVPARPGGEGLLTFEERSALAEEGCELPPDPPARVERELYNLYTACTLPSQKLILLYPSVQDPKNDGRADAVDRLSTMFGLPVIPAPTPSLPGAPLPVSREPLSAQSAAALYGKTLSLSASRLESFSLCPFLYFCRYGLRAGRRPEPGFTPLDVGRELHAILELCVTYAMERGGFAALARDEMLFFAEKEASARLEGLLRRGNTGTPRLLAQGARLARVAVLLAGRLWDELVHSQFSPLGYELSIEGPEIPLGGLPEGAPSGYKLRGVADRVDGFRKGDELYLRVIDYKTGGKTFSLTDVYNGLSAQMPLYLFLLCQDRKAEAAGVLYVQTRNLLISPDARHSGLLLDDPGLLEAMDDRLYQDGGALPVFFNKDGSFSKRASVATPQQMASLQKHIGALVRGMARSVACGRIDAAPLALRESPCGWCDVRAACHFDQAVDAPRPYEVTT